MKGAMIAQIFPFLYGVCLMYAASLHSLAFRHFARNASRAVTLIFMR
ncbi:capsular biosynthesis protein [Escherichia albertii]